MTVHIAIPEPTGNNGADNEWALPQYEQYATVRFARKISISARRMKSCWCWMPPPA